MLYSGTCPRCGATITTNIAPYNGVTWVMCQQCSFAGNLAVRQAPPTPATPATPATPSTPWYAIPPQACPACHDANNYAPGILMPGLPPRWRCGACGFRGPLVSGSTHPPASPMPANTAGASSANTAVSLLEALRSDAQLYGEEIAKAVGGLTRQEATGLTLGQVWDRMQQAQDDLYRALGERRMGDFPPDIEQVTRALVEVGVWHIVALGVVERLNRGGEAEG